MKETRLSLLRCPVCAELLSLDAHDRSGNEIISGRLTCTSCGNVFPIRNSIPRFVEERTYADSFGLQWNAFKREQLDSWNGSDISRSRVLRETRSEPEEFTDKLVLDVGCGAGRFIDAIADMGCEVIGVDISSAIDAARDNLQHRENVTLIQADIFHLPFTSDIFDLVYCIGVIQHTPDPHRAIQGLPHLVRTSGKLAVTIYERRRFTHLHPKYLLRRITTRRDSRLLLRAIRIGMPAAFLLTEVLFRLPGLGSLFRRVIPVANYVDESRLSTRQRYRWAILDTFDMFAPAWDEPVTENDVVAALEGGGLKSIARLPNPGLNLLGWR